MKTSTHNTVKTEVGRMAVRAVQHMNGKKYNPHTFKCAIDRFRRAEGREMNLFDIENVVHTSPVTRRRWED